MDRSFEQRIGRFRAEQFRIIAEEARIQRVRAVLSAFRERGADASSDPAVKKLVIQVRRDMEPTHSEGPIPLMKFSPYSSEIHTSQKTGARGRSHTRGSLNL